MELKEVKEFLDKEKENEEVKTFLQELKKTSAEEVNQFLETDEGKKLLTPRLHSHFDKTLETWKANNLEKEFKTKLDDEIAIRYPEETEEQKRIKALEKSKGEMDNKLLRSELKNTAITFLNEAKLPLDLVEIFIGADADKTLESLGKFKTMMEAFQKKITDELYKKHGREPKEGAEETTPLEDLEKQYEEAMEKGDMLTAMKLHDQIFEQKKKAQQSGG